MSQGHMSYAYVFIGHLNWARVFACDYQMVIPGATGVEQPISSQFIADDFDELLLIVHRRQGNLLRWQLCCQVQSGSRFHDKPAQQSGSGAQTFASNI